MLEGSQNGTSKKAHLLKVWQQTGRMPQELEKVMSPPQELLYLWRWLCEHVYPMSFAELKSWQELTGRYLTRWELQALIVLDRVRSNG